MMDHMGGPRPRPDIRDGALVIMELGDRVVAGIVCDDDVRNPIRMVRVSWGEIGMLADDLLVVGRDVFEVAVYLGG